MFTSLLSGPDEGLYPEGHSRVTQLHHLPSSRDEPWLNWPLKSYKPLYPAQVILRGGDGDSLTLNLKVQVN